MTLCSLGCDKTNLTYSDIASVLLINEDEVETWIVDAVGQNLMEAQIDQITSTVVVT